MFAVALFLAGFAVFIVGSFNPLYQATSGVLIIGSVYVLRISYRRSAIRRKEVHVDGASGGAKIYSWFPWGLGVLSAIAMGVSFFYLYKDALNGYHGIGPVYAFAATSLVAALVWAYLATKLRG